MGSYLTRLILFLIRLKLGVRAHEYFQFTNQRSEHDRYYFTNHSLMKLEYTGAGIAYCTRRANVSLSFLLSDECEIKKV